MLMAFVAMSFFSPCFSFAQEQKAFTPQIKTPNTNQELTTKEDVPARQGREEREATPIPTSAGSMRRLRQHGLGLGLGQTFLLGNYGKYGDDKITMDVLYSYAASYSFDLLVNAHSSSHKDDSGDRMRVMGLTSSIKARMIEYDNFSPFVLGGLGFYAPKAKRGGEETSQKVTFGLNFGGGLDLRLNDSYVVGVLGQMHWPFKVEQNNQSDLKGYYFKLLITGMYLF